MYYIGYSLHLSHEGACFISQTVIGYSDSNLLFFSTLSQCFKADHDYLFLNTCTALVDKSTIKFTTFNM